MSQAGRRRRFIPQVLELLERPHRNVLEQTVLRRVFQLQLRDDAGSFNVRLMLTAAAAAGRECAHNARTGTLGARRRACARVPDSKGRELAPSPRGARLPRGAARPGNPGIRVHMPSPFPHTQPPPSPSLVLRAWSVLCLIVGLILTPSE
ncbi:hypothetical protein chiPu_0001653 [Chiloscyllium punctatum]|uniref:Uncharacterized protein n=1 Tax=Chiloscyllium punctatum TaxID=137246 RepID=A0A401RYS2_CHIPU|nr:hypothetical protein [Chiloscyllium punctatum]